VNFLYYDIVSTIKYNRLVLKFRHRLMLFVSRRMPIKVFTVEKIQ